MIKDLKVLLIAPYYDKNVPGESWCTYKWIEGISKFCETTILTSHGKRWEKDKSPVEAKKIVNWVYPTLPKKLARIEYELKPQYMLFYAQCRKWLKKEISRGFNYDIVHQINPVALRYPSPVKGLKINYILGPHAGSIPTPSGFLNESTDRQWFRKLRNLDEWRIRHDKMLRQSFSEASVILAVAPYVEKFLAPVKPKNVKFMAETGPEIIIQKPKALTQRTKPLQLLFVGRLIRTKGIIDAIRAVALAKKTCNLKFDIIGHGDMMDICKKEVNKLNISDVINFHGRLSREEVKEWYKKSDVFLFPSFREPSGTVIFEALGFALPVITSSNGGPGYVVTDKCGQLVDPLSPDQFASELASAIKFYHDDRMELYNASFEALKRVNDVASWHSRYEKLVEIYRGAIKNFKKHT